MGSAAKKLGKLKLKTMKTKNMKSFKFGSGGF